VGFFGPARETARSAHHKIIGHDAWAGLCDAPDGVGNVIVGVY
jgi:hypothetical protein